MFHHRTYYRNELIINETTTPSFLHCNDMCLQEMQCRDFQYNSTSELCRRNAADFRFSLVGSLTDCEFLCAVDAQCLGYFFKADEKKCRLSNSNVSEYTPWCEYCMFSTKQCSIGKYICRTIYFAKHFLFVTVKTKTLFCILRVHETNFVIRLASSDFLLFY